MRVCLVTRQLSPHMVPLALALVARVDADAFRYVVSYGVSPDRRKLGWIVEDHAWLMQLDRDSDRVAEADEWIRNADVVLFGDRDHPRIQWRIDRGRLTLYGSERWFKPPLGMLRLLHPAFFLRARRFSRWFRAPCFHYLPIGRHAVRDAIRLRSVFFRGLFRRSGSSQNRMCLWAYFVAPSEPLTEPRRSSGPIRILWGGRMLGWKRLDTLLRSLAIIRHAGLDFQLMLFGHGPEELRLRRLAATLALPVVANDAPTGSSVCFRAPVPIHEVRSWMRRADIYVLPSNGYEGWGTVVNEAMLEGCVVVSTHEAGSSRTMIQDGVNGLLFNAGDHRQLGRLIEQLIRDPNLRLRLASTGQRRVLELWTPEVAARRFLDTCDGFLGNQPVPRYADGPMAEVT